MRLHATRGINSMALLAALAVTLGGCAGGKVYEDHPALDSTQPDNYIAKVYFIRPLPAKPKGISDNRLTVEFNGKKLLEIDEGSYALFTFKPASGEITTRSQTYFTNKPLPIEVTRSRMFKFTAGKTYFINLHRLNEEFRGIFFDPEPINLPQARQLAENLSPIGLAKRQPISAITTSGDPLEVNPLEPAFPEHLYPGTPYVIQKAPSYQAKPPDGKNEMTFDEAPSQPVSP